MACGYRRTGRRAVLRAVLAGSFPCHAIRNVSRRVPGAGISMFGGAARRLPVYDVRDPIRTLRLRRLPCAKHWQVLWRDAMLIAAGKPSAFGRRRFTYRDHGRSERRRRAAMPP